MPSVPSGLPKRLRRSRSNPNPIASASLQPYGSFRYKHTRSLSLICRVEVDNILTFGSNVSLRNGRVYPLLPPPRPPFSRRRLCICGGSYHIFPTILPPCFSGGNFSLRLTLSRGQPRAKMARSAGRKQKRPVLTHTDHGKHQKANGARSLKNVPRLCISTSLKARFDKRMQSHSMPV